MAYADIQNKVSQIQMANRILLAQRMDPNKTPETDLEGFQEQGGYAPEEGDIPLRDVEKETPVEGTLTERKKLLPTYKGNRKFPKVKRKKPPSDADIQTKGNMKGQPSPEDIFGPDYEGGPTYLNTLLQIGGTAGSLIPFMGGHMLKYLFGPRAMAAAPYSLNPPRIMPFLPKGRTEYDPLDLRSDDEKENQHMMIYGGKWNKPIR